MWKDNNLEELFLINLDKNMSTLSKTYLFLVCWGNWK
jgi:hypothetical protein